MEEQNEAKTLQPEPRGGQGASTFVLLLLQ